MAYYMTYFRIKCSGYLPGWESERDRDKFQAESRSLFRKAGWEIQCGGNGVCDTAIKEPQELYLHPQSFSGVVQEDTIHTLQELFAKAASFQCYAVDQYEEYRELCDEEYWAELESKREAIVTELLKQYKTKLSDHYIVDGVGPYVAEKYTICRICDKDGKNNLAYRYVSELTEELIQAGRLVAAETEMGTGIRAATRKELYPRARQNPEDSMTMKMKGW